MPTLKVEDVQLYVYGHFSLLSRTYQTTLEKPLLVSPPLPTNLVAEICDYSTYQRCQNTTRGHFTKLGYEKQALV